MSDITVLMSTSPVPSNPSIDTIFNTIMSIRFHLPTVPILIMSDGPSQEHRERRSVRKNYEEFRQNLLDKVADVNTRVLLFDKHIHQAEMTRQTLGDVKTPLLMFVEHDTPLLRQPIEWVGIENIIEDGLVNYVRFHHINHREPLHEYLMCGDVQLQGVPVIKTRQYSQRPHVASVGFYTKLLKMFRRGSCTMIEDFVYDYIADAPWESYKLAIYNPAGSIQRSEHTDARGNWPKIPMRF